MFLPYSVSHRLHTIITTIGIELGADASNRLVGTVAVLTVLFQQLC